jgi:hypothetical protein
MAFGWLCAAHPGGRPSDLNRLAERTFDADLKLKAIRLVQPYYTGSFDRPFIWTSQMTSVCHSDESE